MIDVFAEVQYSKEEYLEELVENFAIAVLTESPEMSRLCYGDLRIEIDPEGVVDHDPYQDRLLQVSEHTSKEQKQALLLGSVALVCESPLEDEQAIEILNGIVCAMRHGSNPAHVYGLFTDAIGAYSKNETQRRSASFYSMLANRIYLIGQGPKPDQKAVVEAIAKDLQAAV